MAASALIILGCALAVGAAIGAVVRIRFLMRCAYAVARVTETSAQEEESGEYRMMQTYYRSSLMFETGEGRTVSFRHDHGTRNPGSPLVTRCRFVTAQRTRRRARRSARS